MNKDVKKEILIRLGDNIRQCRIARGYTQERLANDLGVEISQVSRIERGVINTSVATLYDISKTLNVDISQLFLFDLIS